jgi:AcrR family transcriptional regulator
VVVKRDGLTHRQRQALATREQVANAARRLFAERGYVATTIAAISEAADIPAQTIYSSFGNKGAILTEISQMWMAESDTRELHNQALAEPDPAQRVRMVAHLQRRQLDAGNDVITIYQEAARADQHMAAVLNHVLASREGEIRKLIDSLAPHLAPGLTVEEAMDRFLACSVVEVFRTLVHERGWTSDQYETWLADLLVVQLLGYLP